MSLLLPCPECTRWMPCADDLAASVVHSTVPVAIEPLWMSFAGYLLVSA